MSVKRKNRIGKAKRDAGNEFWIFSENCQKITTENAQIWIFLKTFKVKVYFDGLIGSLAVSCSRNVFTGFRTVARKSSIGGLYVRAGGLDIQI